MNKIQRMQRQQDIIESANYVQGLLTDKTNLLCILKDEYQSRWFPNEQHIVRRYKFYVPIVESGFIHNIDVTRHVSVITGRKYKHKVNGRGGVLIANGYYSEIVREVEDVLKTNIRCECFV